MNLGENWACYSSTTLSFYAVCTLLETTTYISLSCSIAVDVHMLRGYHYWYNWRISQIPQCNRRISHNAPFCHRNVHICYSVTKWCIVGYSTGALWDLCNRSILSEKILHIGTNLVHYVGGILLSGEELLPPSNFDHMFNPGIMCSTH